MWIFWVITTSSLSTKFNTQVDKTPVTRKQIAKYHKKKKKKKKKKKNQKKKKKKNPANLVDKVDNVKTLNKATSFFREETK